MIVKMNLENRAFDMIASGIKDIEMRLFDEKRQFIEVGDQIIFTNLTTRERLYTQVQALYHYASFEDLYAAFDKTRLGYRTDEDAHPSDMAQYYETQAIETYGVLGIELKLIDEIDHQ